MSEDTPYRYSDNVRVASNSGGSEYLAVSFRERTKDDDIPYEVAIYRYCVPGRCDTYHFDWTDRPGEAWRLRYFSDGHLELDKAINMAKKDLDKPQVVELFKRALEPEKHMHFSRILQRILQLIAPKSKTLKMAERIQKKLVAIRTERIKAEDAKNEALVRKIRRAKTTVAATAMFMQLPGYWRNRIGEDGVGQIRAAKSPKEGVKVARGY
jgi:hypothetical protein